MDVMFWNEPARSAYTQFRKFFFEEGNETSTLIGVRLDAYISCDINTFAPNSAVKPESNESSKDGSYITGIRSLKGRNIPRDSIFKFKSLLPIAASKFQKYFFDVVYNALKE